MLTFAPGDLLSPEAVNNLTRARRGIGVIYDAEVALALASLTTVDLSPGMVHHHRNGLESLAPNTALSLSTTGTTPKYQIVSYHQGSGAWVVSGAGSTTPYLPALSDPENDFTLAEVYRPGSADGRYQLGLKDDRVAVDPSMFELMLSEEFCVESAKRWTETITPPTTGTATGAVVGNTCYQSVALTTTSPAYAKVVLRGKANLSMAKAVWLRTRLKFDKSSTANSGFFAGFNNGTYAVGIMGNEVYTTTNKLRVWLRVNSTDSSTYVDLDTDTFATFDIIGVKTGSAGNWTLFLLVNGVLSLTMTTASFPDTQYLPVSFDNPYGSDGTSVTNTLTVDYVKALTGRVT